MLSLQFWQFRWIRWWHPVVLLATATVLAGCGTIEKIGTAAGVLHAGYCEASDDTRTALRSVLTFDDGSPKLVVFCEPHGG